MTYKRIRKIGQGGMGEVWLVSEDKTRHYYAAKFLNQDLSRSKDRIRFVREIVALQSLDHPCIIKIYDVIDEPETFGYIMEYCPDGNLEDYLKRNPLTDPIPFIQQLLRAVDHVHSNSLIHRDIKPANILIAPDGRIRLSDFGLVVSQDPGRTVVTTSNWTSQGFAAPEQYHDMAKVTLKADVFSLGAVWYFCITKRLFDISRPLDKQAEGINELQLSILSNLLALDPDYRWEGAKMWRGFYPTNFPVAYRYFETDKGHRGQYLQQLNQKSQGQIHHWDTNEWQDVLNGLYVIHKIETDVTLVVQVDKLIHWLKEEGESRFVDIVD